MSRTRLIAAAVAVIAIGGYFALDALIVTDEDRVREFATTLNGEIGPAYIDQLLTYIDVDTFTLEVQALGESTLFRAGQQAELRRAVRQGLRGLSGSRVRTLSRSLELEGDSATVEVRLFTDRGVREARFRLRRNDERWLVEWARVR